MGLSPYRCAVQYTLFTFGESELQYILVVDSEQPRQPVSVMRGEVKITRPVIITPNNASPDFEHFFEDGDEYSGMIDFLMMRSAAFRHLQLSNLQKRPELMSDSVEEIVAKLNKKLDSLDEDRVAVLTAPHGLGGVAVLKYAADRVMQMPWQHPGTAGKGLPAGVVTGDCASLSLSAREAEHRGFEQDSTRPMFPSFHNRYPASLRRCNPACRAKPVPPA